MSGLRTYLAMQDRDVTPYTPGEASANLVSVIAIEAGSEPVPLFEAHGAYIELGCHDVTVGQVAERVLERRGERTRPDDGQTTLFV